MLVGNFFGTADDLSGAFLHDTDKVRGVCQTVDCTGIKPDFVEEGDFEFAEFEVCIEYGRDLISPLVEGCTFFAMSTTRESKKYRPELA